MATMSSHTCEAEDEPRYEGYYGRCGDDATHRILGLWVCKRHYHEIVHKEGGNVVDQAEIKVQMVRVQDLKPAPWEPQERLTERAIRDIRRDIAQAGIMQPVLVRPDMTIIDGHRRVECAKQLGLDMIPVIISEREPKAAFAAVNETMRKVNSSEGWSMYMKGGTPPAGVLRAIREIEVIGGGELLRAIYEAHLSPSVLKVAVQGGLYCGFREDREMMEKTLHWLIKHRMQRNLRYACDSGTPPAVIFRAITSDRPLSIKVVTRGD